MSAGTLAFIFRMLLLIYCHICYNRTYACLSYMIFFHMLTQLDWDVFLSLWFCAFNNKHGSADLRLAILLNMLGANRSADLFCKCDWVFSKKIGLQACWLSHFTFVLRCFCHVFMFSLYLFLSELFCVLWCSQLGSYLY